MARVLWGLAGEPPWPYDYPRLWSRGGRTTNRAGLHGFETGRVEYRLLPDHFSTPLRGTGDRFRRLRDVHTGACRHVTLRAIIYN